MSFNSRKLRREGSLGCCCLAAAAGHVTDTWAANMMLCSLSPRCVAWCRAGRREHVCAARHASACSGCLKVQAFHHTNWRTYPIKLCSINASHTHLLLPQLLRIYFLRLLVVDDFMSSQQCKALMELAEPRIVRSRVSTGECDDGMMV